VFQQTESISKLIAPVYNVCTLIVIAAIGKSGLKNFDEEFLIVIETGSIQQRPYENLCVDIGRVNPNHFYYSI
jgi:hypothetical protein